MYEELMTLTGDEDEYWDEEMGFGNANPKPPPPYMEPSTNETGKWGYIDLGIQFYY
jgi:hypothetical protein